MRKVTMLKQIEDIIQQNTNYNTSIDYNKPKFMGTFPYPYMNGKLHLGHAFTMCKVDFECRWKQINGYNVLFPFGFHCTGMPICAAAKKLEKELESCIPGPTEKTAQYNIMLNSGIEPDQIPNFINPEYWVQYFPALGLSHIKKLGIMADTSRSFVTTKSNPFYDSFIQWQFTKLHNAGYLKYGTRNSIYSESLDIQCQDHDRTQGEGIQNTDYKIVQIQLDEDNFIWIPFEETFENKGKSIKDICISPKTQFALYSNQENNVQVYMTEYVYKNYEGQYKPFKLVKTGYSMEFDGVTSVKKHSDEYFEYLGGQVVFHSNETTCENYKQNNSVTICDFEINLPTGLVIDRMGGVCYVKPMNQWFIDYANPQWKQVAHQCVDQMKLTDKIKSHLSHTIDWLKEWGVSRPFGLGTKLPTDPEFVIDSLSDSTIYPAYYTIANFLHKDIYGQLSEYDYRDFTYHVWEYIFNRGNYYSEFKIPENQLEKMRESFEYFYPVDLRVSGKDLLTNHLGMYIFNHAVIFDKKYWPVSINCNGWVLVNGEKMSKSKGNFITIESATETNCIDAVRLTLADSGDNMDDANYVTANAGDHSTLKLFSWIESVEKYYQSKELTNSTLTQLDKMFQSIFANLINQIVSHYNSYNYRNIVRDAFHNYNGLREKYRIYCKYLDQVQNWDVIYESIKAQTLLLFPIIPHIATHVWTNILKEMGNITDTNITKCYLSNLIVEPELVSTFEQVDLIINEARIKIEKHKKKNPNFTKIIICTNELEEIGVKLICAQLKCMVEFETSNESNKPNIKFG